MSERLKLRYVSLRYPFLFAFILLVVAVLVNFALQPNLLEIRVLNGNMRNFLPLMIVAVGQTIVIIGGGVSGVTTGIVLRLLGYGTRIRCRHWLGDVDTPSAVCSNEPGFASPVYGGERYPHTATL